MARNDPMAAYKAQGIPQNPVGALDELAAHKLPTRVFPSCAEPSYDETIKGCPCWSECTMSYKGLPVAEGGGPRHHAWERIMSAANGGGIARNVQPCYWGVAQQEIVALNKEILRVIADEGDEFEMLTTVPDLTGGRDQWGALKWDSKLLKVIVNPFVRLGQEQALAKHELRASIVAREQERLRNERPAKALGLTGGDTPLDKRNRVGLETTKKKD